MSETPMCVMCRTRPMDPKWRPFCSERCQQRDLGQWASGTYRIAAEPPVDEDEDEDEDVKPE